MDGFAELLPARVAPDTWDAAHRRVWAYFAAMGVRHDFLLYRLVQRVMDRTAHRLEQGDWKEPVVIASEEVEAEIAEWFRVLLQADGDDMFELSLRGRLALLLAEMPQRWHGLFLTDPPWPDEFVTAVRESHLRAVPELRLGKMDSPPLNLGTIPRMADGALQRLDRMRPVKLAILWAAGLALGALVLYLTR